MSSTTSRLSIMKEESGLSDHFNIKQLHFHFKMIAENDGGGT